MTIIIIFDIIFKSENVVFMQHFQYPGALDKCLQITSNTEILN